MSADDEPMTRLESGVVTRAPATSTLAPDLDDGGFTPGTILQGRYRIVGLIGRGGMGTVYRAQDLKLGQSVALKFLPEIVRRDTARLERFLGEVRIARQISHPNVCRVYDVGEIDGRHFLSMEFVDGEDLASLLRRIGRLPADKGVEIARQLCAGLAAAHDRGVLHRDLKPANIMIDGRGHARLADFGLAAAAADLPASGEIAGTPAYMAPEQLEGQELSTKADLYALGLVLHELFTGKRVFDSNSVQELREQHRSGSRSALSSGSFELDPAIDRVIRLCLQEDPRLRPASALAVAAALPGGDPLAAALAAGETPSPELIAQSGDEGRLTAALGWALLAAAVVGIGAIAWFASELRFYRLMPGMRSPEVLTVRAEDLLDALGYGEHRADRLSGWRRNAAITAYVEAHDRRPDRWDRLAQADPPYVYFWYRQSPEPMVAYDLSDHADLEDPPPLVPGMATVTITPRGRLVSFSAVPLSRGSGAAPAEEPDWDPLFAAAGIDRTTLTAATPVRTPATFADRRAAWEGRYPGRSDWPMRIEAAAHAGRPIWFDVAGPWASDPGVAATRDRVAQIRGIIQVLVLSAALIGSAWLARRNLRAGRADRHGALLIGVATGAPLLLASLARGHHAGPPDVQWIRFVVHCGLSLFWGGMMWLVYVALEPEIRRRWPEAMVSWARLLVGRFTDPLVGRDILVGCVGGAALGLSTDVFEALYAWLGYPPIAPSGGSQALTSLATPGAFTAVLMDRLPRVLMESLLILVTLLLADIVFRKRWLAYVALTALFFGLSRNPDAPAASAITAAALVAILVVLISRFGVLAYTTAWFVYYAAYDLPLVWSPGAWYTTRSAIAAALIAGVAAWGFYWSTVGVGGRRLGFGE